MITAEMSEAPLCHHPFCMLCMPWTSGGASVTSILFWVVHYPLDVLLYVHHTDSSYHLGMPVQAARLPRLHTHMPVSPYASLSMQVMS